jgi:hypothetical protein
MAGDSRKLENGMELHYIVAVPVGNLVYSGIWEEPIKRLVAFFSKVGTEQL